MAELCRHCHHLNESWEKGKKRISTFCPRVLIGIGLCIRKLMLMQEHARIVTLINSANALDSIKHSANRNFLYDVDVGVI